MILLPYYIDVIKTRARHHIFLSGLRLFTRKKNVANHLHNLYTRGETTDHRPILPPLRGRVRSRRVGGRDRDSIDRARDVCFFIVVVIFFSPSSPTRNASSRREKSETQIHRHGVCFPRSHGLHDSIPVLRRKWERATA